MTVRQAVVPNGDLYGMKINFSVKSCSKIFFALGLLLGAGGISSENSKQPPVEGLDISSQSSSGSCILPETKGGLARVVVNNEFGETLDGPLINSAFNLSEPTLEPKDKSDLNGRLIYSHTPTRHQINVPSFEVRLVGRFLYLVVDNTFLKLSVPEVDSVEIKESFDYKIQCGKKCPISRWEMLVQQTCGPERKIELSSLCSKANILKDQLQAEQLVLKGSIPPGFTMLVTKDHVGNVSSQYNRIRFNPKTGETLIFKPDEGVYKPIKLDPIMYKDDSERVTSDSPRFSEFKNTTFSSVSAQCDGNICSVLLFSLRDGETPILRNARAEINFIDELNIAIEKVPKYFFNHLKPIIGYRALKGYEHYMGYAHYS